MKWKGWPAEYNQWVREEDMEEAQELHSTFMQKRNSRSVAEKGSDSTTIETFFPGFPTGFYRFY